MRVKRDFEINGIKFRLNEETSLFASQNIKLFTIAKVLIGWKSDQRIAKKKL